MGLQKGGEGEGPPPSLLEHQRNELLNALPTLALIWSHWNNYWPTVFIVGHVVAQLLNIGEFDIQRESERSIGYVVFALPILGGSRVCTLETLYRTMVCTVFRARIFKCLWGPGIDSKE